MDLSRAKTILIAAFLMLNLFLGYRLWYSPQMLQSSRSLTGQEVDRARQILENAGFELTVEIPRQVPRLSFLHVSRNVPAEAAWAEMLLGEGARRSFQNNEAVFTKGDNSVIIARNGQVSFKGNLPMAAVPGSGEDLRQLTERFLRERKIWRDDMKFDLLFVRGSQEAVTYRYVQTYQGFPLFFSTVEVTVRNEHVKEVVVYRVLPQAFSSKDIQAISALEAVEAFAENAAAFPSKRVTDISLGYFSQDYDAASWEIVPVWRIATADGSAVYMNAFTGEAESPAM